MIKRTITLLLAALCMGNVQAQTSATSTTRPLSTTASATRPLIGISCSHPERRSAVNLTYTESVIRAGGVPMMIPVTADSLLLRDVMKRLDGIIMTGGEDIHPSYYGEEPIPELGSVDALRDVYDLCLIRLARDFNVPMLGICRGEQLINVAFGGSLYQDIPSQCPDSELQHQQKESSYQGTHLVHFEPGSQLATMIGHDTWLTNSHHHQAVKQIAPSLRVTARTDDGIVEGFESCEEYPVWGVQFHPEALTLGGDTTAHRIIRFLVQKARTFQQAKAIHSRILSIDTHTDAPLEFTPSFDLGRREASQVCLPKMEEGYLDGQYLACWVRQKALDEEHTQAAMRRVEELMSGIEQQIARNADRCALARTADDLPRLKAEGKKAIYIGIENGYGIGTDLHTIRRYHERGVTYITLCHTRNNAICDSSSDTTQLWGGLSPYGRKVVKLMNKLGMLIDLSHASETTFWEVLKRSKRPVFASHSSAKALFGHDRNLTDEQLRALARQGGVVQVCPCPDFLRKELKNATLTDFMHHLEHAIEVAGIDHVGIGTDFDGGGGVKGCNGDNDLINITVRLLEAGYDEEQIGKLWGGNFLRLMKEVQQ